MSNEDVIIAFLRKEPLCRGKVRSNGFKLFVEDTCIAQWLEHKVLLNNTNYGAEIGKIQTLLYRWLIKSYIIFRVLDTDVPKGKQQIISYYNEE